MSDELTELPEGWIWATIGEVAEVTKLAGFEFTNYFNYQELGDVRVIRGLNIGFGKFKAENFKYINVSISDALPRSQLRGGEVLITYVGTLGSVAILPDDGHRYHLGPNVGKISVKDEISDARYLMFFLLSPSGRRGIHQTSKAVAQSSLSMKQIRSLSVPLPPVNEQKRIVAKIEELNDRHQRAKQALEAIPKLCDRFRQSVLAVAFRGDLTADWREQNLDIEPASKSLNQQLSLPDGYQRLRKQTKEGFTNLNKCFFPEIPETWKYSTVQELYDKNFILDYADGNHGSLYPRKEEFGEEGVLYITASQIADGKVNFSSCPRLNLEKARQLVKGWAQGGDVLLTHNATVGRTALVEDEVNSFLLGTSVTFYRTNYLGLNNVFFYLFLSSQLWQQQLHAVMAQTTRNQVSIQKQAFFLVPIPPIEEQLEIVKQVQSHLGTIQKIEQQYGKAEANFAFLNQAILAKAFRGELVEQDPNDEPASGLLDRIRKERESQQPKTGKKRGKRQTIAGQMDLLAEE